MLKLRTAFTLVKLAVALTVLATTMFAIDWGPQCCGECPPYVNYNSEHWDGDCFFMDGSQSCSGGDRSCHFMACEGESSQQFCDGSSCMCLN